MNPPRRYALVRDEDASGVSGTGLVALGVQWPDGVCALRWVSEHRSTAVYDTIQDVEAIHGHGGRTRIVWMDPAPGYSDGDDLVSFCSLCGGGHADDLRPSEWCIGCGARGGVVMLPRWLVHDLRRRRDRASP